MTEYQHCWGCGHRFGSKHDGLCVKCRNNLATGEPDYKGMAMGCLYLVGLVAVSAGFAIWFTTLVP